MDYPKWLNQKTWSRFVYHRKEMGKPLSKVAEKRAISKLGRMVKTGQSQDKVIQASIDNVWTGLFDVIEKPSKTVTVNVQNKGGAYARNIPVMPKVTDDNRNKAKSHMSQIKALIGRK